MIRMRRGATVGVVAVALLATSCGMCGDEDVASAVSPDGRLVARAFVRNCGATTDYVTRVEVASNRRWFRNPTSVYVVEGVFTVQAKWSDRRRLVIVCDRCPAFPPDREWGDFEVVYRKHSGKRS